MDTLRIQWGEAPWPRGPELASAPATSGNPHGNPDVAIIGAGLTGTSTALHLARRGIRCAVYEAGLIADGASGRTGGLVLEGTAAGLLEEVDACVPGLARLVADEGIDCNLALPGCWEIEHRKTAPARMLPWSDAGRPVCIAKNVGGGVVQPAALTMGLARAALRAGADIRQHTRVTRISLEPELALEVGAERITPGHIVIANNAWINATLPDTPPLASCLTFACATEPLDAATLSAIGLERGIPFYTTDLPYLWGRTMPDGGVLFGAGLVFGAPAELEHDDVLEGESHGVLERLQQRVRELHPSLAKVRFSAAWGGPIAFADDMIPLLGAHPRHPRVMVSGGYAGHGVALSVRAGELLTLAIADGCPLPQWGSLARFK
jgi:gamma-glutamylputrescine oxidase